MRDGISALVEASESGKVNLQEVIKETESKYNERERSKLTPGLHLVSLLTLANEQSLDLEYTSDLSD